MNTNPKTWLSLDKQLELLASRNVTISDSNKAKECLERIGYYRLSGYLYPFKKDSYLCCKFPPKNLKSTSNFPGGIIKIDDYQNVNFETIIDLYIFDKKLRLLILDAIERIEIALRSQIAHLLGEYGPYSYLESQYFYKDFTSSSNSGAFLSNHHLWLTKNASLIKRSKEDFIKHHKDNGLIPIPIWVICEVWDFGALATLYEGMLKDDQDKISCKYGIQNGRIFYKWLQVLGEIRNVCAHHSRLWNRNILNVPTYPPASAYAWLSKLDTEISNEKINNGISKTKLFSILCICSFLVKAINPNSEWVERLIELLKTLPDMSDQGLGLNSMGLDQTVLEEDWEDILRNIRN